MKTLKADPGAKRLIESLRNMGYDCSTAIADLVDNSITANASEIYIDILLPEEKAPAAILIADNGKGMDKDDLHQAMRFGAFQEYSPDDLGKYGLGLKTASLGQCRTLTVASKAKAKKGSRPRRVYMRWDLDHVYKTDDWNLLMPSDSELKPWEAEILNHKVSQESGTVVLWNNLDEALPLLSDPDIRQREKFLAGLIEEVSDHLRMVFHRFMQGAVTGRRKLNIYVCGELLLPWDPFCRKEKTHELDITRVPLICIDADGLKVKDNITVSPFILPREDEFSSVPAWKDASGPRNWNQQQGFYFYRNNRLLQAGGWSYLRAVDEHTKLLRVAVDFSSSLDRAFSINITKMRARIPAEIREEISSHIAGWTKKARERYDNANSSFKATPVSSVSKPLSSPISNTKASESVMSESKSEIKVGQLVISESKTLGSFSVKENKKGEVSISIPQNHEFSEIFTLSNSSEGNLRRACLVELIMLEAISSKKMRPQNIPLSQLKKIYRKTL